MSAGSKGRMQMTYWIGWIVHVGCMEPSRHDAVGGGREHRAGSLHQAL